jgi:hypothetical protein
MARLAFRVLLLFLPADSFFDLGGIHRFLEPVQGLSVQSYAEDSGQLPHPGIYALLVVGHDFSANLCGLCLCRYIWLS